MRLPAPGVRYDQGDESQTRRIIEQELSREVTSVAIGGGRLYEDPANGKLTYRGRSGTITILALP